MKRLPLIQTLIFSALILAGCGRSETLKDWSTPVYEPDYAVGYAIYGADGKESVILETKTPWQGGEGNPTRLFIARNGESAPKGFDGQVLEGEAKRIVCMSSSHIAMLDAIGATDRIVGVSGMQFITNDKITSRADNIGDVGYDNNIDYELLISLNPDLVLLYGVNGSSNIENKLREVGIPFAYIGEYLEQSPMGKAEWLIALAEIVGMREAGIKRFEIIPDNYGRLRQIALSARNAPKVMVNAPYNDIWYMPSTSSYMVRLIHDANGAYIYNSDTGSVSKPVDLEEAYLMASDADIWLNVGQIDSFDELKAACPKFYDTKPVKTGKVFNCNKRSTPAGGNDFWESGIVNPDLILQDLITILHPEIMPSDTLYYYKQLK